MAAAVDWRLGEDELRDYTITIDCCRRRRVMREQCGDWRRSHDRSSWIDTAEWCAHDSAERAAIYWPCRTLDAKRNSAHSDANGEHSGSNCRCTVTKRIHHAAESWSTAITRRRRDTGSKRQCNASSIGLRNNKRAAVRCADAERYGNDSCWPERTLIFGLRAIDNLWRGTMKRLFLLFVLSVASHAFAATQLPTGLGTMKVLSLLPRNQGFTMPSGQAGFWFQTDTAFAVTCVNPPSNPTTSTWVIPKSDPANSSVDNPAYRDYVNTITLALLLNRSIQVYYDDCINGYPRIVGVNMW